MKPADRLDEMKFHYEVMELWYVAEKAGYASADIKTFTFRDIYLDKAKAAENDRAKARRMNPPYSGASHHNCVRLKSDDIAEIPLVLRPAMPDAVKVKVEEVE